MILKQPYIVIDPITQWPSLECTLVLQKFSPAELDYFPEPLGRDLVEELRQIAPHARNKPKVILDTSYYGEDVYDAERDVSEALEDHKLVHGTIRIVMTFEPAQE